MRQFLLAIVLTTGLGLVPAPEARADFLRPTVPVVGVSQAEWSARWWQWAVSYPEGGNPLTDTTGAFSHLGDMGQVFFLAGSLGEPTSRTVTVRSDQTLFLPLIPIASLIPVFGMTEAEIRLDAALTMGPVSNLFARLDGVDIPLAPGTTSLLEHRQLSPPGLFPMTFPPGDIFGLGPGTYPSVSDGYWAMLEPLPPGTYRLDFGGDAGGTPGLYPPIMTRHTHFITVTGVVPEPSSVVLLGVGVAGLLVGVRYTRRRTARAGSGAVAGCSTSV